MDRETITFCGCALQGIAAAVYLGKEFWQWVEARRRGEMKPLSVHHPIWLIGLIGGCLLTAALGFWFVFHPPRTTVVAQLPATEQAKPTPNPTPVHPSPSEQSQSHVTQAFSAKKVNPERLEQKAQAPAPGSITQSNSGGVNVLLGTTGADSPIIDSPITIGEVPKHISDKDMETITTYLQNPTCKARIEIHADQLGSAAPFTHDLYRAFQSADWIMDEPGVNTRMVVGPGVGRQQVTLIEYGDPVASEQKVYLPTNTPAGCVGQVLQFLGISPVLSRTKVIPLVGGSYPEDLITIDFMGQLQK